MAVEPKEETERARSLWWKSRAFKVFVVLPSLPLGLFFLSIWIVNLYLADRCQDLHDATAEYQEELRSRPALIGEGVEGNAVNDYNAIEWMFHPRESWLKARPDALAKTEFPKSHFANIELSYDHCHALVLHILKTYALENSLIETLLGFPYEPSLDKGKAFYQQYGKSLIRHVRAGIRKKTCDWKRNFTLVAEDDFSVVHGCLWAQALYSSAGGGMCPGCAFAAGLHTVAKLMLYESTLQNSSKAISTFHEMLAFADDIARIPDRSGALEAAYLRSLAYLSLKVILKRPLSRSQLLQILRILGNISLLDLKQVFRGEHLIYSYRFANIAEKRDIQPNFTQYREKYESQFTAPFHPNLIQNWSLFDEFFERILRLPERPLSLALSEANHLDRSPIDEQVIFFLPQYLETNTDMLSAVTQVNIQHELCVLGVAALLYFKTKSQWPSSTSQLSQFLDNETPKDPYTDGKNNYQIKLQGSDLIISTAKSPFPENFQVQSIRIHKPQ